MARIPTHTDPKTIKLEVAGVTWTLHFSSNAVTLERDLTEEWETQTYGINRELFVVLDSIENFVAMYAKEGGDVEEPIFLGALRATLRSAYERLV